MLAGATTHSGRLVDTANGSKQPADAAIVPRSGGLPAVSSLNRGFAASSCGFENTTLPELIARVQGYVGVKDTADTGMLSQVCTCIICCRCKDMLSVLNAGHLMKEGNQMEHVKCRWPHQGWAPAVLSMVVDW